MKKDIFGNLKNLGNKIKLGVKKHSPEILISAGVVGVVISTVMACVSTGKAKKIVDAGKKQIADIHKLEKTNPEEYAERKKKELTAVYFRTGFKLVKTYAPSVVLGVLSLTSIISSNNILRKRNMALAVAYTAVDNGFKRYRANVVERFGEDVDKELKYGIKTEKVTEETVDSETGKKIKVKKEIKVANLGPDGYSEYARFFDKTCKGWTNDVDYNLMTLKGWESFANDKLRVDGYLFLNDVYDLLGIPKSKAGQVVGWIYDKNNNTDGDNYVSFGLVEAYMKNPDEDAFEQGIILDFNVDGYIMDKASLEN